MGAGRVGGREEKRKGSAARIVPTELREREKREKGKGKREKGCGGAKGIEKREKGRRKWNRQKGKGDREKGIGHRGGNGICKRA